MIQLLILLPLACACGGYVLLKKKESAFYYLVLTTCVLEFLISLIGVFDLLGWMDNDLWLTQTEVQVAGICDHGLSLAVDGFRRVYVVVIAFMWMMTMALSKDYFKGHHHLSRYFFFMMMTLSSTMGVFLAADLFTAFVFFEVMSFTSFPWVIQEETEGAIKAANTYLAVAVIGGLTALMGIFLLEWKLGTTEIARLYETAAATDNTKVLYIAGGCILFGFGAKAGMFPLHIWLPKAHPVAPAPASALLSGVLTKSGVWGVLVLSCDLFRYDPAWGTVVLILGTITMLLGAVLALFSTDLKRTLACSSMSQIGFILVGVGMMGLLGEENALAAHGTLLHMMNHSLFKLVLFMCAGVVYMNVHKLDLNEIRGFGRGKWILMLCFLAGAVGIGGIPGLNGYVSKTLLHEAIVEGEAIYGIGLNIVEWIFLFSGGLTLAYMTKLFVCLFLEKSPEGSAAAIHAAKHGSEGKGYMSPLSSAALIGSAILLPILGLTCSWSMDGIATIGTDFFHCGELEHAIHYFSLENLKGALISLVIGAAIYFLVVRKWMIRDGRYVDRWPAGWDLEERIYRPLLLNILPDLFGAFAGLFGENQISEPVYQESLRDSGVFSHAFSDVIDGFVFLMRKTLYKENELPDPEKARTTLAYRVGHRLDVLEAERTHSEEVGHRHAHRLYRAEKTFVHTTHNLMDSLSFALLMMVLAICAILVYVLVIYQ